MRDWFTTARAVGEVNNTASEPGIDTRLVYDTGSHLSIAGGKVVIDGGANWGDPRLVLSTARTRVSGRGMSLKITPANTPPSGGYIGWSNVNNPSSGSNFAGHGIRFSNNNLVIYGYDGTNSITTDNFTIGNDIELAIILKETGAELFSHDSTYGVQFWRRLAVLNNDATTPLYPAFMNRNIECNIDDLFVFDLLDPRWSTIYGTAKGYKETVSAGDEVYCPLEAITEFTWTPDTDEVLELDTRRVDANNRYTVRCDQAAGTIVGVWIKHGVETLKTSHNQTWTVGTPYRIMIRSYGSKARLYVDGVSKSEDAYLYFDKHSTIAKASLAGSNLATYPLWISSLKSPNEANNLRDVDLAYAANAENYLTIPTYEGSGQCLHPDVYYNADGWNGYKYWMAFTPFAVTNPTGTENPSIVVSNDGNTWVVPEGLTNPVVAAPGSGYNSDPDLLVDESGTMWLIYRTSVDVPTDTDTISVKSSTDGVTWSAATPILVGAYGTVKSPAIIWDGNQYVMFYSGEAPTYKFYRRTCATLTGTWSDATEISLSRDSGDFLINHQDVIKDGDTLWMIAAEWRTVLFLAKSTDNGLTWTVGINPIMYPGKYAWESKIHYRSSILRTETGFDLFYTGEDDTSPVAVAHIGRTSISL